MAEQMPNADGVSPRVPRGRALHWDKRTIAELATITEERIAQARAAWQRQADPQFRDLLDALVE